MICSKKDRTTQLIDKEIKHDKKVETNKIKLLLLGAGESGKSTFAKQMQILHLSGFQTNEERSQHKHTIFKNILDNIISLSEASEKLNVPISQESQKCAKTVLGPPLFDYKANGLVSLTNSLKLFWDDPGVKQIFDRAAEFQLNDSAAYFFSRIEEIGKEDYIPTVDDILRSRAKTTGIHEMEFSIGKNYFRLVDVGGQRSERRKWIHCFEEVTAIIFFAALSEYDQTLLEDNKTNRMHESLKLFRDIVNSRWFRETAVILFLNKKDLFTEKIEKVPLTLCFPDYKGQNDFADGSKYIQSQFEAQLDSPKNIYPRLTCATDTENIKAIFDSVKHAVVVAFLNKMGFVDMGSVGTPRDNIPF